MKLRREITGCQYCGGQGWLKSFRISRLTVTWGEDHHRNGCFHGYRPHGGGLWFDIRWDPPLMKQKGERE